MILIPCSKLISWPVNGSFPALTEAIIPFNSSTSSMAWFDSGGSSPWRMASLAFISMVLAFHRFHC
ncbi:hypothetical protein JL732_12475 [Listeria welshimeri]|uniref:hypothetical protein n=1 Tax=Listeria welshimeri TaxID=1643 RepID=UPI00162796C4|nr:hypothetical protein [Listeria welshimeri]MBS9367712.1 hypothetical protein [Listeria welshimeri]